MTRKQRAREALGKLLGMESFEYVTAEAATVAILAFANQELERAAVMILSKKYGEIEHDHETEMYDDDCDAHAGAIRAMTQEN